MNKKIILAALFAVLGSQAEVLAVRQTAFAQAYGQKRGSDFAESVRNGRRRRSKVARPSVKQRPKPARVVTSSTAAPVTTDSYFSLASSAVRGGVKAVRGYAQGAAAAVGKVATGSAFTFARTVGFGGLCYLFWYLISKGINIPGNWLGLWKNSTPLLAGAVPMWWNSATSSVNYGVLGSMLGDNLRVTALSSLLGYCLTKTVGS